MKRRIKYLLMLIAVAVIGIYVYRIQVENKVEFKPLTYQILDDELLEIKTKSFYKTEIKNKNGDPNARWDFESLKRRNP